MMPIAFLILLWITAIIFLIADWKNESYRWASATLFLTGLGGVDDIITNNVIPIIQQYHLANEALLHFLIFTAAIIGSISILFYPYCVLMFSISYTEIIQFRKIKWKIPLTLLLLIPVLLMYRYIDISDFSHLDSEQIGAQIVTYWAAPYILMANFLLIYSYFQTPHPKLKQERLLTCLLVTPITIASLIFGYVIVAFGVLNAWKYQIWTTIIFFIAFIICAITYGAIGVRIKFGKNRLDNTLKAVSSGTLLLSHAIKNEITKIAICIDIIKSLELPGTTSDNLQIAANSVEHLTALVNRINEQTQEIILTETPQNLNQIISEALTLVAPFFQAKKIQVINENNYNQILICDPVHLREVLINICKNAVEAMNPGGLLRIQSYLDKKRLTVTIEDNGSGIDKENLPRVFEPFFSTKNRQGNFGLGLSYCYNVMKQHGGALEINSQVNQGTTVLLHFNPKKVFKENPSFVKLEVSNVQN